MSAQHNHGTQLLKASQVMQKVGLCRTALYARINDGTLPAPIKLGGASRWDSREVDLALVQLPRGTAREVDHV